MMLCLCDSENPQRSRAEEEASRCRFRPAVALPTTTALSQRAGITANSSGPECEMIVRTRFAQKVAKGWSTVRVSLNCGLQERRGPGRAIWASRCRIWYAHTGRWKDRPRLLLVKKEKKTCGGAFRSDGGGAFASLAQRLADSYCFAPPASAAQGQKAFRFLTAVA